MKFAVIALVASTTSAAWGTWNSTAYCDYNNDVIDEKSVDRFSLFSKAECASFCQEADLSATHIPYGTHECCDYEYWSDGSTDCTLYMGNETLPNYFNSPDSNDRFQSMTFNSGDYNGMSLVGKTKQQVLKLRQ